MAKLQPLVTGLRLGVAALSKAFNMVLAPLLLIKDITQSLGFFVDSEKEQGQAQARLGAGLGAGAVGGVLGGGFNPVTAAIGYSLGREAPGIAESFSAGDLEAGPGKINSVTTMSGHKIGINSQDGVKVSPNVGGLGGDDETKRLLRQLVATSEQILKKDSNVYMDGAAIGKNKNVQAGVLSAANPVAQV
ncbi:MAG: hypothetical protein NZ656_05190, partial [Nitrospinaceae bacterium]|nr:hypothetical protein [Nitrospinaceae bacterium]